MVRRRYLTYIRKGYMLGSNLRLMLLTCCGIIFAVPPIVFCIEYAINWSHE